MSEPKREGSKVPKLFGRISGDLILFVSSERRGLEARNFAVISPFILFTTYDKNQLCRVSGSEFYEWLFWPEKVFGTYEERAPEPLSGLRLVTLLDSINP